MRHASIQRRDELAQIANRPLALRQRHARAPDVCRRESFQISRGSVGDPASGAPHLYVRVTTEDGSAGWGEARPSHRWSYETMTGSLLRSFGVRRRALLVGDPAQVAHLRQSLGARRCSDR